MKTTRSKLWKPADQKCENQRIKMKTSRPKADAESGDRKGSVLNFNDSSIRLSFVRKVTHFYLLISISLVLKISTLKVSHITIFNLQTSIQQRTTVSGVWPGVHSIGHHLGFCSCILTWRLQPERVHCQIQVDLLCRILPRRDYHLPRAGMQHCRSKNPPHQPPPSCHLVHLWRLVHWWACAPLLIEFVKFSQNMLPDDPVNCNYDIQTCTLLWGNLLQLELFSASEWVLSFQTFDQSDAWTKTERQKDRKTERQKDRKTEKLMHLCSYPYINIIWFCMHWLAMSNSCYNPFIYLLLNVSIIIMRTDLSQFKENCILIFE